MENFSTNMFLGEHSVQFPQSSGPLVESKSEWKAIVHPLIIVVKLFDGHRMPRAG